MKNETYNGWTNYATWRINLEIFDGYDTEGVEVNGEYLEEIATEIIGLNDANNYPEYETLCGYAFAFLSDVNWREIAEHLNDNNN